MYCTHSKIYRAARVEQLVLSTVLIGSRGRRMTQGVALTEAEQEVIRALHREGRTSRYVSTMTNRSRDAVLSVIRRGVVRAGGRKRVVRRKLFNRVVRLIVRQARTGLYTARELRDRYAPHVTVRRVQQLLAAEPDLRWERAPAAPRLETSHKLARLEWGRRMAVKGERWWRRVVFSD